MSESTLYKVGNVRIEIEAAPQLRFPSATDCNSPCWWSDGLLYITNSTGHPIRSWGRGLEEWIDFRPITYTAWRDGGRWFEAAHQDADGTLYAWYHNEPAHLIGDEWQQGRRFPLTAPFIGAAVSYDNGDNWDDLGLILAGGPETLNIENHNYWFAGGNGDFSVVLDQAGEYFYFLLGTYYKDVTQQGICLARMHYQDRGSPVGKVYKWHNGEWREPGLNGKVTPILPVRKDWYAPEPDTFWGPSVHWNHHIQKYVILLNRAIDPNWKQEGVYICFTEDIGDPDSWSEPLRILDGEVGWYPQVVGSDTERRETDRLAGRESRLFVHGKSDYVIRFSLD